MASRALTGFDDYREMLADRVRMDAWAGAIADAVRPGDTVVDLGAGTGILSFLALEAGAARVHAIEQGNAIELARAVAEHNGWTERVVFHEANSRDVVLDEPADVLISETLGSIAVDENTLVYTIDARERLLRPSGRMVPHGLSVWLAPVDCPDEHARRVDFWADIHGIDFTPAAEAQSRRMGLFDCKARDLLAAPAEVARIDLATVAQPDLQIDHRFVFARAGVVHGLAGWFEARLAGDRVVRTGPDDPPTHWRQAFLPFREAVAVGRADILDLRLRVDALGPDEDQTRIAWDTFCSQIELDDKSRERLPCPCGSGRKFKRCCGAS